MAVTPIGPGRLKESQLAEWSTAINNLLTPGWTAYTPSWTSSGTAPAIGNGTIAGRYRRPSTSDLVLVEILWVAGSTTTFGTGTYFFSVPTVAPSATAVLRAAGVLYMLDSGTQDKAGVVKLEDATKFTPVASSGGVVTSTNPHTWANGDRMRIVIEYEPA